MLRLLCVPYHLGHHGVGMGNGPDRLLAAGAADTLRSGGHQVVIEQVDLPVPFAHETGAHFALQGALADRVRRVTGDGDVVFVLGGNCSCVLGVVAGLERRERTGVVWFDAHGDANTPDTTPTGFLDGMGLAVLTGRCWAALVSSSLPGWLPLPDEHIVLAGVRDLDDDERELLASSAITLVAPDGLGAGAGSEFATALDRLAARIDAVHLHVDLDVIDAHDGRANEFAVAGGPSLHLLEASIKAVADHCRVDSVSLTSFNPAADPDERALAAGMRLLETLAEIAPVS